MPTAPSTASETLCRFCEELRFEDIPPEVIEKAKLLTLDLLGISLAARADPIDVPIRAAARAMDGGGNGDADTGPCSAVGETRKMPALSAAFLNAALGHSLDFDDTHSKSIIHTAAPVVPPALAAAEGFRKSGREMLRSITAAFEGTIRIGLAAPGRFHARGFHMTSIAGTFGAALAYGPMAGLKGRRLVSALGICGSMASGLFEYLEDGSPVKVLHPGWAAHSGIMATVLAGGDFGGPASVFEGRFGLLRSHLSGEDFDAEALTEGLGERWETLATGYKPYPCGHVIHAFLDAALRIREEGGFAPEGIESVTCHADKVAIDLVLDPIEAKRRPRTHYEGKFSLPYCLGSIFVRGRLTLDDFTDEAVRDERVLAAAAKVDYRQDDSMDSLNFFPGKIEVRLKGGKTFAAEEKHQRGCAENPMAPVEVQKKFMQNAQRSLPAARAEEAMDHVLNLDVLSGVAPLTGLLREAGR
ncbi:MAG: MmgE/PrpD family protein [Nitrospinota bacterium]